nr:MAG: CDT phosphatase transcription factor [Diabrotica toursvirus 3a]
MIKNIFLDLDQTIIYSEQFNRNKHQHLLPFYDYTFVDNYITFARPHLQLFLDYIFENFTVNIWTAASKNYASYIYHHFIKRADRKIKLILFDTHCQMSLKYYKGSKNLNILWDKWKLPGYDKSNTFIIDDLVEIANIQPQNTFKISQFTATNGNNDIELLKLIKIFEKLQ